MANKMMNCKSCGKEIAKSAKTCPNCGAKNKKPIYKRWWFWVLVVIILAVIGSNAGSGSDSDSSTSGTTAVNASKPATTSKATEATTVETTEALIAADAQTLYDEYEANEIKANQTYEGKMLEITGTVSDIGEILGQTFILLNDGSEYNITGIQCMFKDKAEIDKIAELTKGDTVTVIGKMDGRSINVSVSNCRFK